MMTKSRIVFLVWLLSVGCLHIFGSEHGTRVILYSSVTVPAVLIFLSWLASRRIDFFIPECGKYDSIYIRSKGGGFLPGYIKCRIVCKNLFTGEFWEEEMILNRELSFSIAAKHCGMISISVSQALAVDIFGLRAWKIDCTCQKNVLIMPQCFDVKLELESNARSTIDSDEYSMRQSGNDPSEIFEIREYLPGDPLKSIHWKLSVKADKLLVRELGLPIVKKVLVLMETSTESGDITPVYIDTLANALYSIAHQLVMSEILQTICWFESGNYKFCDITSTADLDAVFMDLLKNPVICGATESYSDAFDAYSHIIIVGLHTPPDAGHDFPQNAVTVFDCTKFDFDALDIKL